MLNALLPQRPIERNGVTPSCQILPDTAYCNLLTRALI
jgi:hypothetical protein